MRNTNALYTTQSLHMSANHALEVLSLDTGMPMRAILASLVLAAAHEDPRALRERLLPYAEQLGRTAARRTLADHRVTHPTVAADAGGPLWAAFVKIKDYSSQAVYAKRLAATHASSPYTGEALADAARVWKASPPSCRPPEYQ